MLGRMWAAAKSVCRKASSAVKSCAGKVVASVKKGVEKVKRGCAKVLGAVTGKKYFDEAEGRYRALVTRYEEANSHYRYQLEQKTNTIKGGLEKINGWKVQAFNDLFPKFIQVANRLHNVEVNGKHFEEYLADDVFEYKTDTGIQKKEELFEIDFNNISFKQAVFSILTLGAYSRRKAQQSLQQVKDEEQRVSEEIAKQNAQLQKVDQIISSIANVVEYFDRLISNYKKLLKRFEFGVNSQRFLQARASEFDKLDLKLMPIKHIEDFHALFNLSVVLKAMSTMGYISESGELVNDDLDKVITLSKHTDIALAA